MSTLNTEANLAAPDELYAALIAAHDGLDADESALLNAKLVFLLANHIGDRAVIDQAIAAAREDVPAADTMRAPGVR